MQSPNSAAVALSKQFSECKTFEDMDQLIDFACVKCPEELTYLGEAMTVARELDLLTLHDVSVMARIRMTTCKAQFDRYRTLDK